MAEGPEKPPAAKVEAPGGAPQPIPPSGPRRRERAGRTEAAEAAYPSALLDEEEDLIAARRGLPPETWHRPVEGKVGIGLSGGGIRAATFCLGFFQGLAAKDGLIRKLDYLSTVSGGGYFGAFLGRLFTRDYIRSPEDVESILTRDRTPDGEVRGVVRNLRENGRYLSPNGSGDLLLGGAVLFRNWVSLQVVLWTFLLMVFLTVQALRVAAEVRLHGLGPTPGGSLLSHGGWVDWGLWWSPFLVVPAVVFILCAFPLGWAYWLVERVGRRLTRSEEGPAPGGLREDLRPFGPLVLVGLLNLLLLGQELRSAGWAWRPALGQAPFWIAAVLLVVVALTPVWWVAAKGSARRRFELQMAHDASGTKLEIVQDATIRNLLSRWLKTALVWTGGLLALALVDTLGQTLYLVGMHPEVTVLGWIGGTFGGLTALAGFARRFAVKLATDPKGGRVRLPVDVLATAAGLLVALFLLVTLNAASHAVAWTGRAAEAEGDEPGRATEAERDEPARRELTQTVPKEVLAELFDEGEGGVVSAEARVPGGRPLAVELTVEARAGAKPPPAELVGAVRDSWPWLVPALGGLAFTWLLSRSLGRIWPFVNRSSHQPLYSARLTRAYLGASNPKRLGGNPVGVTHSIPGDDLDLATYWPPPGAKRSPIHLINVTVNETIDGRSQVEQKDRKGMGLALGPSGLSVGVRHHLVAPFGVEMDPDRVRVFPQGERIFRVFEYLKNDFRGEVLPLGAWVGISGAAFSTGLGTRTSLGLSILLGLTNVRLGYWWDSGVDPRWRAVSARRGGDLRKRLGRRPWPLRERRKPLLPWPAERFAVQRFLGDELLARFPGTARRHWYLSDGGHFENMGGYELIRRRLPLAVIIDAEADPDYNYGGLANLVRKARLDFGAEIDFMSPKEIDRELPPEVACHVGSLAQLRRGRWTVEGEKAPGQRPAGKLEVADRTGRCLVHAALARVRYLDDGTESRLLYIKPSLLGDEPEDVLDYHRQHEAFPQETTADQFFDEAQWESYRRLGQHIAEKIFRTQAEAEADLERVREPRTINTDGDLEPEEEREKRLAPLWHPGRLDCPPRAVTHPGEEPKEPPKPARPRRQRRPRSKPGKDARP